MTSLTVRIRSESGMKRLECDSETTLGVLKAQIASILNVFPDDQILSRDGTDATAWRGDLAEQKTLAELGIKHGDMLFLKSKSKSHPAAAPRRRRRCRDIDALGALHAWRQRQMSELSKYRRC
jgi:hypothetical protein